MEPLSQWCSERGLHTFGCIPVLAAENLGLATWNPEDEASLGKAPWPTWLRSGKLWYGFEDWLKVAWKGAGVEGAEEVVSVLHTGSSNVVADRGASTVGARLPEVGMGAGVENRRIS